jgi:hypothetical protein
VGSFATKFIRQTFGGFARRKNKGSEAQKEEVYKLQTQKARLDGEEFRICHDILMDKIKN